MIRLYDAREDIARDWPTVKTLLEPAIERSRGFHSFDRVFADLMIGDLQLWVGDNELACLTRLQNGARVKMVEFHALGGAHFWRHRDGVPMIEDWARSQNCSRARIEGREEWRRLMPGYSQTGIVLEKDL